MPTKEKKTLKDKEAFVCAKCGTAVDTPFEDCPKCGDGELKKPNV